MKKEIIKNLAYNFEDHSQTTENGIEFWFARDLQQLLGYSEWRNFNNVIKRAKNIIIHKSLQGKIIDTYRIIAIGSGAKRKVLDYKIDNRAKLLVSDLSKSYKLNNSYFIRNETVVLQLVEKYCVSKRKVYKFQFKIENYFYDFMIDNKILFEFDEPHHKISKRQKDIDFIKNNLATLYGFNIFRISLKMDIIDIILFLQKNDI